MIEKRVLLAAVLGVAVTSGCLAPSQNESHVGVDFRTTIQTAEEAVFPALVYVRVVREELDEGKDSKGVVSGSGVIISADGEVLTNWHVIDKALEVRCLLTDGSSYPAKVIGKDQDMDVALLKLQLPDGHPLLPAAELSDAAVHIGDVVLAMGAPWGLARSVTMGIISCTDRYLQDAGRYTLWYQTDAAISPGNSGGPLVDTSGKVVGINTLGNIFGGQAFTIPASAILEVLPNLRERGDAGWSWFGISFQPLHDFDRNIFFDSDRGVVVSDTEVGSPARKAGLHPRDLIVAIDGAPVTALNWEDLPAIERKLGRLAAGKDVAFHVVRGDEEMDVVFAPREKGAVQGAEKVFARWGLTAKEINRFDTPDLATRSPDGGVFISAIAWDGNAYDAHLRTRDIIRKVGDATILTLDDLVAAYDKAMERIQDTTRVTLQIERNGRTMPVILNYLKDPEKDDLE